MEENVKKVLSKLQGQCARREYCSQEVYSKACKALEGDASSAAEVVASLVEEGYVSDRRFALAFARDKSSLQGWGSVKISHMLRFKGIDSDIIREALLEIDADKADRKLEALVMQKKKTLEGDPQIKFKLLKFALGRGYLYEEVKPVVEKALAASADGNQ